MRRHALDVAFHGELRPEQKTAARAMLAHDTGVLAATTAFGKTVVAAWLIAERGVNTLVLVHRRQLLEQWVERLSAFLGLPPKAIGRIGGGREEADWPAGRGASSRAWCVKVLSTICVGTYGHLIVDECHHLSAQSFEQVVRRAKAKYVTGSVGHRHAQGRPSSDHLHAMRAGATSRRCEGAGGCAALSAHRDGSAHGFPSCRKQPTRTCESSFRSSTRS